jgi:hypothetical protein
MKVRLKKSSSHPLLAIIGNEIGEVTCTSVTDGVTTINANFNIYGGEVSLTDDNFDIVE